MPLTYEESAVLMADIPFRGRIKVACLKLAKYIMNEENTVPGHTARRRWADRTYQMPDQVAMEIQSPTVMADSIQGTGATVSDADLQTAVEGVVNPLI